MRTLLIASLLIVPAHTASHGVLPVEPELTTRLDELYDHEARLFLMLYSLKGDGQVDYVTGRSVQEYARSNYGNPVYKTDEYPLFYWWDHTMWNDPEQDGVNGNERVCGTNPVRSTANPVSVIHFNVLFERFQARPSCEFAWIRDSAAEEFLLNGILLSSSSAGVICILGVINE